VGSRRVGGGDAGDYGFDCGGVGGGVGDEDGDGEANSWR